MRATCSRRWKRSRRWSTSTGRRRSTGWSIYWDRLISCWPAPSRRAFRWPGGGPAGLITVSAPSLAEDLFMRHAVLMISLAALLYAGPGPRGPDKERPAGFANLFNGKDLSGWEVNEGGRLDRWGAADGLLFT